MAELTRAEALSPHMPPRLAAAHRIVIEAADLALAAFADRGRLAWRTKQPQDFVSQADEQVEGMIRRRLAAEFPGDAVRGEEGGSGNAADASTGSGTSTSDADRWFIDPIDGTSNFLRGSALWGISLGLVRAGRPALGMIAFPALGLLVGAELGSGLYSDGQPALRDATFDTVRLASVGDADVDFEQALALTGCLRRAGWVAQNYRCTTLGLAYSALGRLDGHLQHRAQAWDIAAGLVLCAEAGLEVSHGPLNDGPSWVCAAVPALRKVVRHMLPFGAPHG